MRFAVATVALFAGLVAALPNGAESTVYQTEEVTITSCAPTVTDCPARATETGVGATGSAVPTSVVTPSVPAGGVSPVGSSSWSSAPAPAPTSTSTSVATAPRWSLRDCRPRCPHHLRCCDLLVDHRCPHRLLPCWRLQRFFPRPLQRCCCQLTSLDSSATAKPSSTPAFNGAGALSGSLGFAGAAAAAAFFLA
ncbi:uncharacterized protein N7496_009900 [Penicillium cataractarum]|uniref:Hydrophobin n=1 Tax=Penicillium cataractarum TaxID=2100454 RepID=A0A9W9RQ13_9EURO|nr:uncharacterized protein N7496_009900 [Penicillium cataractarum]KAJ5364187.1 hypothetical protein N7496_009900 [Penicillium cataractarum]